MGATRKLIEMPAAALLALGCGAIVLMMLHSVADVLGKYLFNTPIRGTIEVVAAYYMVAVVFFPLAHVTRERAHIAVELFTRGLDARRLARLNAAVGAVTLAFMAALSWFATEEAIGKTAAGEVWDAGGDTIAVWPSRWALAVGCIAMAACAAAVAVDDLRRARRPG